MSLPLFVFILSCIAVTVGVVMLLRRARIWRLRIVAALFGLAALGQTQPLFATHILSPSSTTGSAALLVSIAALLIFLLYDHILAARKLMAVKPQELLETALDAMVIVDQDGKIIMVNARTEALFGYTRTELLGAPTERLVPEPLRARHRKQRADYLAHLTRHPMDTNFLLHGLHKDGSIFPLAISLHPLETEQGLLISCAIRDITEHKKAKETLRQSDRFLRSTLNALPTHIAVLDENGTITAVNKAWQHFAEANHAAPNQVGVGANYLEVCDSASGAWVEEAPVVAEAIRALIAGRQKTFNLEYSCHSPGKKRWFSLHMNRFVEGKAARVVVAHENITERKQAEEQLIYQANLLQNVLDAVIVTDLNFVIQSWNHAAETLYGWQADDVIGKRMSAVVPITYRDASPEDVLAQFRAEGVWKGEIIQQRRDGTAIDILASVTMIRDGSGQPTGVIAVNRDITERKQAEERETRLGRILEHSLNEIYIFDADTLHFLEVNRGAQENIGYSFDELRTLTPLDLKLEFTPETFAELLEPLRTGAREKLEFTTVHRRKDGSLYPVEAHLQLSTWQRSTVFVAVILDITKRKQAEKALRDSEERNRALLDGIPDMMFRLRTDGTFLDYKAESEDELAVPREAIIGSTLTQSPMPAEIVDDMMRCVEQAMTRGEVQAYEYELSVPIGIQTYEARFVRSGADEVVCIVRNVTERKRAEAEQERLIDELEARNAELERFTYTVSHDLKTPLVTIKGFLGLLMKDVKDGHETIIEHDIEQISKATDQMARLLNELLELSRIGRVINPSEEVSLTALAHDALKLVAEPILERGVTVEIAPDLPVVFGDKIRLLEVFQNLLDNAVKFMGDQPEPYIKVACRSDNGKVVCYVEDNGIGIAQPYQEQVFGLFNRLDQNVDGTGIGLALVKRIIEMHGGQIWVESGGEKRGSTFCFMLPE